MDRFQVGEFVVVGVYASAEKEARIAAVHNLAAATEFNEVRLVLLVSRRDQPVDFAFQLDLLIVAVWVVPFRKPGLASNRRSVLDSTGEEAALLVLAILNEDKGQHHVFSSVI